MFLLSALTTVSPLALVSFAEDPLLYLGQTNVFNVLLVLAFFLILYKWNNMSISRGLDNKIKDTVHDLHDAEMLQNKVNQELEEAKQKLTAVEAEREERRQAATLRGQAYEKEKQEETQRKFRQLRDQHEKQKKVLQYFAEKKLYQSLASQYRNEIVEALKAKQASETFEDVLAAMDEIERTYRLSGKPGPEAVEVNV